MTRNGVLFLCVANSSRSQMAEGFARKLAPAGVEVFSAGSAPTAVNPFAVAAMREVGIDLACHHSKAVAAVPIERIGTVITLCQDEVCPVLAADVRRLHWPFADPAAVNGSPDEVLEAFRRVRDQIERAVSAWFNASPIESAGS